MAKFELKQIPRGENGGEKGFFISTFRFDLMLAQAIEKIALGEGLSMSSVVNQVLQNFVDNHKVPDIKPIKTLKATVWGDGAKPKAKPAKKVAKVVKPAKKLKVKKVVEEDEADEDEEPAPKAKKAASSVLNGLKRKQAAAVDNEVPADD